MRFNEFDYTQKQVNEMASYVGNIGIMELVQFFNKAKAAGDYDKVDQVKQLADKHTKEADLKAWKIIQDYMGVKLKGKQFGESSLKEYIKKLK